jgi:hypothetical protein
MKVRNTASNIGGSLVVVWRSSEEALPPWYLTPTMNHESARATKRYNPPAALEGFETTQKENRDKATRGVATSVPLPRK